MENVKTEYNRLTSPGLSRQEMREEIKFLQKEMNSWMSIAVTRDDQLKKAKKIISVMVIFIVMQWILIIFS